MPRQAMRPVDLRVDILSAPELASQTFKKGAVLIDSGGFLKEAGADPNNIVGVSVEKGHNSSANGDNVIKYVPCTPKVLFEATFDDSADLGNGTTADTDINKEYGIAKDSDGKWYIDKSETTAGTIRIQAFRDRKSGIKQGRVLGYFSMDRTIYEA